jgi:hypothetical protein
MKITKVTSLLVVDQIEPCLPLWENLGFARTVEVPDGSGLGFVILAGKETEVMLQTRASLSKDMGSVAPHAGASLLYCDVDSIAETRKAVQKAPGCKILIDERTTAYGARELWMLDAAGHLVGFAEHV